MSTKPKELDDVREVVCPFCQGLLQVSADCISIPCRHCNRHVDVREILFPSKKKKIVIIGQRSLTCYKCCKEIVVDKNAQAVNCKYCYHHNDLSNYKIKNLFGKIIETHGLLYLRKKGFIENSSLRVGNALIKGKINGDISALGTIEINKRGEIHGNISCCKFIVRKGGTFEGNVSMK